MKMKFSTRTKNAKREIKNCQSGKEEFFSLPSQKKCLPTTRVTSTKSLIKLFLRLRGKARRVSTARPDTYRRRVKLLKRAMLHATMLHFRLIQWRYSKLAYPLCAAFVERILSTEHDSLYDFLLLVRLSLLITFFCFFLYVLWQRKSIQVTSTCFHFALSFHSNLHFSS